MRTLATGTSASSSWHLTTDSQNYQSWAAISAVYKCYPGNLNLVCDPKNVSAYVRPISIGGTSCRTACAMAFSYGEGVNISVSSNG